MTLYSPFSCFPLLYHPVRILAASSSKLAFPFGLFLLLSFSRSPSFSRPLRPLLADLCYCPLALHLYVNCDRQFFSSLSAFAPQLAPLSLSSSSRLSRTLRIREREDERSHFHSNNPASTFSKLTHAPCRINPFPFVDVFVPFRCPAGRELLTPSSRDYAAR